MPLRTTTHTSTPHIRIEALDAYERVTDFASAADHTQTLRKWQEVGLPLMTPAKTTQSTLGKSLEYVNDAPTNIFEDKLDTTALPKERSNVSDEGRWKFRGPWIAGMTEGEFNSYVSNDIRSQKLDFQKFLRAECARNLSTEQSRAATDSGEVSQISVITEAEVTQEQFNRFVKDLRENEQYRNKLICQFLDLPPLPRKDLPMDDIFSVGGRTTIVAEDYGPTSSSPYAETGPPRTHPSGGLSYGRTTSHIHNHHVFGPQKHGPPVPGRVVMPKNAAVGNFKQALGVSGFITRIPNTWRDFKPEGARAAVTNIEPDKEGGSKGWVEPTRAWIDAEGKVQMVVKDADPEAVAVMEGTTLDMPVIDYRSSDPRKMKIHFQKKASQVSEWANVFKSIGRK